MRSFLLAACGLLAFTPVAGLCAPNDPPISAAQRQAQIDRIRDGLNSPDPTKRLVTLEEAVVSKDRTLRRVALSTAFTSSDADLRGTALSAAIASAPTFVVDIVGGCKSNCGIVFDRLGKSFEVRIQRFDRSNNTFQASTSASVNSVMRPGSVSGDRLSFEFDVSRLRAGSDGTTCSGVAQLEVTGSTLKGSLSCHFEYVEDDNYDIAIAVPM